MRLVGPGGVVGSAVKAGRLEIFHAGAWGTVCDLHVSDREAAVICGQLGFPGPGRAIGGAAYGQGTGRIWLEGLWW